MLRVAVLPPGAHILSADGAQCDRERFAAHSRSQHGANKDPVGLVEYGRGHFYRLTVPDVDGHRDVRQQRANNGVPNASSLVRLERA